MILKQRYQIMTKLGQGGFAAVYKAQDLQLQPSLRAIKEMDDTLLNPQEKNQAIAAFQQEANILARLMHPNLPRIYDYFAEQQHWYLVMDYIDGETLETLLAKAPQGILPVEKVIHYGLQICTVLKYLHNQMPPIIFRDLKPSNIMINPEDHLYLIDFGIARFFKPGQFKDTIALGSPGYAAPEQYGKEQTTTLTDIYGFGATLHHMLSGRDPINQPFIFPPLPFDLLRPQTQALNNLVARMVAIKKEERPASILEIQTILYATQQQINQAYTTFPPRPPHIFATQTSPLRQAQTIPAPLPQLDNTARPFSNRGPQGSQMWAFPTSDEIVSSPAVVDGIVYFGSHDRNLYALDAFSGRKIWSFLTGHRVKSSPTVVNGIVYFGSSDYRFYALDASSGRLKWSFPVNGEVRSSPAVVNGIVYFGSYDRKLYALDASSGVLKWTFPTGGDVFSSPTVVDGIIYLGSHDYRTYALDASSGRKTWSLSTGGKIHSSPTVANGVLYVGSDDYNLHAINTASGQQKWSFPSGGWVHSSPTVVNGIVYFGSDDQKLYALEVSSGRKLWLFQTNGRVHSSPTVVNDVVYVGSRDGKLYAINA